MVVSFRILIKIASSKVHMNSKIVQGQNKHNSENQKKSLARKLYE